MDNHRPGQTQPQIGTGRLKKSSAALTKIQERISPAERMIERDSGGFFTTLAVVSEQRRGHDVVNM
ncbi:hypothetical protein BQ8482_350192 [Mesorhizobium delmotii]|uniref:Uncharacterized protein n=1 Tax=Mesorhizobium delmotii TaxID=1631247 RepID=A0A2P9AQV6_9HYPH|nr:hypothetical protein BQ8482_350192 [Mesorhizobium delmotii]